MSAGTALVWFRRDLRLSDNPALRRAVDESETVVPVFIHDEGEGEWAPLEEIAVAEGDKVELDLRVRFEIGKLTIAVRPEGKPYVVGIRRDERTMLMPTDQYGRLVLDYFPSGDYRICAWADISPDEANDSATWERAGDAVREFRHDEGVDMEITLTAAP